MRGPRLKNNNELVHATGENEEKEGTEKILLKPTAIGGISTIPILRAVIGSPSCDGAHMALSAGSTSVRPLSSMLLAPSTAMATLPPIAAMLE